MAGPKVRWWRIQYDYWKYCARERAEIFLSLPLIFLGLLGLMPIGPSCGLRNIVSFSCFFGAAFLVLYNDIQWKNRIKQMTVGRVDINACACESDIKIYRGRPFIISEKVNQALRSRRFQEQEVIIDGSHELHTDAKKMAIMFLEYYRLGYYHGTPGKQVKMWNDLKIRLHCSKEGLLSGVPVRLRKTTYFDYLGASFLSCRKCLFDNVPFYDGVGLMKTSDGKLASLEETKTAHHIGVNALLITKDKKILYQRTSAPAAPDSFAPSGSGSLDLQDVDHTSFEKTLLNGALRELSEETGWNEITDRGKAVKLQWTEKMFYWPLGMSIDLSRGMVTDFFFVVISNDTHVEYQSYYQAGKVLLDEFELEKKRKVNNSESEKADSIRWQSINAGDHSELRKSIRSFKDECLQTSAMLSLSLEFLLQAIEEQSTLREKLLE